ncbi:MAG: Ribosomal silencing factor RsfS [Firmicutes bacterium]|nr:Ribosomal silencing factor RsfS [candidate division NPL-UPA2 bacterium]
MADDKKALRPVILDLSLLSHVTDYFLIVTATSRTHSLTIADHIEKELVLSGKTFIGREGDPEGIWMLLDLGDVVVHVLLDLGDVVVHVFREEAREFYALERLWGGAKVVVL